MPKWDAPDLFLKKLLICALLNSENSPLIPIEIDIADLENAEIRREWKNIDILIYSPSNNLVCAIENKVDSSEHSNQLKRYQETIEGEFLECRKVFIYLTKEGDSASEEQWLSLSYDEVAKIMESICQQYQSTMGDDVHTLINHYVSLIRRHLVSNSEIAELCQKIYKQHQQALDLIYEHRPDLQSDISELLQQIIQDHQQDDLEEDKHIKTRIRFAPKEWDSLAFQKTCEKWTSSKRILLFEFCNEPQSLGLHLVIGPGEPEIRQAIYQTINELNIKGIDKNQLKPVKWSHIWKLEILNKSDYSAGDWENIQGKIESFWHKHLKKEVQQIREAISNAATLESQVAYSK